MKIVFMGTPSFAVPILKKLNEKYEITLVVSQPDRERKKGVLLNTPVKECALSLGLEVFQPESIGSDFERIKECDADVLVTAAYGQYIPTKVLKLFKKTINVHGSLLPHHRGGAPIQRAIMNGDEQTGVTLMEMAKKLDAGKMYAKVKYQILDEDNSTTVFQKLSDLGAKLLIENIDDIYNGINEGVIQDDNEATYSPNLLPSEEVIDFNKPARLVVRHIHAMAMEPGAYFIFNGVKVKVFAAKVVKDESDVSVGTILSLKKQFLVKTKTDAVLLEKLLLPGKKIVDVKDFVNGQKLFKENDVI